jgi:predicted TPR repeat methyltransferase
MAGLLLEKLPLLPSVENKQGEDPGDLSSRLMLRILDLGAGNGMMGEEIRSRHVARRQRHPCSEGLLLSRDRGA